MSTAITVRPTTCPPPTMGQRKEQIIKTIGRITRREYEWRMGESRREGPHQHVPRRAPRMGRHGDQGRKRRLKEDSNNKKKLLPRHSMKSWTERLPAPRPTMKRIRNSDSDAISNTGKG